MKAELAFALLTVGSTPLESVGSAFDGLKASDIAHALGGLPAGPTAAGMHAWADGSVADLRIQMVLASSTLPGFNNSKVWRSLPNGSFLRMVDTAIRECVGTNVCPKCGGRHLSGSEYTEFWGQGDAKPTRCDRCGGTGKIKYVSMDYADHMGLSLAQWKEIEKYFDAMVQLLDDWLYHASRHIYRKTVDG